MTTGVLASQIAFFALALFASADYFFLSSSPQVPGIRQACLFLLILFGAFLFWGTIIGIFENYLFSLARPRGKNSKRLLRTAVYALSLALLVGAPIYPLLESIMVQRSSLDGWLAYLSAAVLSGITAAFALKILADRCANPLGFLLSAVIASTIFFLAARGTSLFFLLKLHFRTIQLSYYLAIWWGSLLSLGILYQIGHFRDLLTKRETGRISSRVKTTGFVICPLLAIGLCWIDGNIYVGLYGGAHLFVRFLAYLFLDLFALILLVTTGLSMERKRIKAIIFFPSLAVIALAGTIVLCLDPRSIVRSESHLDGSLIWPILTIKYHTMKGLRTEQEAALPPKNVSKVLSKAASAPGLSDIPRPAIPRVFLIVIDCLRADHLSCYGYERTTSPNIDALAKEAVLFRYCITPGACTTSVLPTMFTSRVFQHLLMTAGPDYKLSLDNSTTMAQVLEKNNFQTLAIGLLSPSYWGYSKGFHDWFPCPDDLILDKFKEKVETIKKGKTFCYFHYMEPHDAHGHSYSQPGNPRLRKKFKEISFGSGITNNYDTAIKLIDLLLGDLMDYLKSKDLYDESIIIITADNGIGLGEHGYIGQRRGFYNGEALVPLIIKAPGCKGKIISETVGTIDLLPTILDLVGIESISGIEGRSLTSLLFIEGYHREPQVTYCHAYADRISVVKGDYKLIFPNHPRSELYAFKTDPLEEKNIIDELPQVVADLTKEYEEMAKKNIHLESLPPAAIAPEGLQPGLRRKLFDNTHFHGKPVSETIVVEDFKPQWDFADQAPPEEGFSVQWDGYIDVRKGLVKEVVFRVLTKTEIKMWIDGVKIMDATQPQRSHHPTFWEGYAPVEPGVHALRIRISEKRDDHPELTLFYILHGKRYQIPSTAFFHTINSPT